MDRLGYSLVQPILSSSYKGYGTSSLRQDVEELDELLAFLKTKASSSSSSSPADHTATSRGDGVILIGHSTGCQDMVFYMKHGRADLRADVRGVVLQAPVSDRDYLASLPETEGFIQEAKARGGGGELMPVEADEAPITAARYLSLATKEGDDDMFSSELTVEEQRFRLGHMSSVPTAAFLSGADEYVPPGAERSPPEALAEFFRAALCGGSTPSTPHKENTVFVIDGANHALSGPSHAQEFVEKVEAFVAGLPG